VPTSAANVWGLVDLNDQREYAVIGLRNGTAVVDVTNPASPREVATVPGNASLWREVKIYQHFDVPTNRYRAYAYVSTEAPGSGIQVIDLGGLPNSVALATTLADTGSQHTLYVSNIDYSFNTALQGQQPFLFVAGSRPGTGNWRAYSLADPANPAFVRASPLAGYMHDSTSLHVTDNRTTQCAQAHNPCEVLVDFNENTVDLWDVTDKVVPVLLSSTTYPSVRYTHSGWPSADQRHLFIHDELEEIQLGLNTQIYTMTLDDLRTPSIATSYFGPNTTTDHNGYTKGNLYYVSHYRRGLVVFDVTNPNQLREIGSFDTFLAPAADSAGTDGAWGVYPFLPSGAVVISDITNGLFVLKDNTPTLGQSAGRLGFAAQAVSAFESAGSATVRVQRSLGFAGAVSIQYATSDGTAMAGADYTAANGTLNWGDGDFSDKTFTIPVANDTTVEPDETLIVTLSNATGGATIDGSTTLTVTIGNDDATPSGGGGGGGTVNLLFLALLALLATRYASGRGSGFSRDFLKRR
jgi:choice-of-anchor B domain-containing protein